MANKNYQIAKFYNRLFELQQMLNSELLPLGVHIAVSTNDAKLFESMEVLAADIESHLENYDLSIGAKK